MMQPGRQALDPSYVPHIRSLAGQIQAGRHSVRERWPSRPQIAGQPHASRLVVRQVLQSLAHEGVVYIYACQDTTVTALKIDQQLRTLTGFCPDLTAPAAVLRRQRLTFASATALPVDGVDSTYRGGRYKFHSTLRSRGDPASRAAAAAMGAGETL